MQQIGPTLEKIMATALRRSAAGEGPLLAWPLACGQRVAKRTRALDFSHGILRVQVPDAGWRTELQSLAPRYVAVMNRYLSENVSRIEFVLANNTTGSAGAPQK
jgi:hypothetical protein